MFHRACTVLVAAAVLAVPAVRAAAQEAVRIESIRFEGNKRFSDAALKNAMRSKEGKMLDRELLARDISMLHDFFDEIAVVEEPVPGGLRLVFKVSENPLVSRVDLLGVDNIPEADLLGLIDTRGGYPLAGFRLENDVRVLERRYREDGYHFVEVKSEILEDEGARRVVFRVVEGPEVLVEDVLFEGAPPLKRARLLENLELRPSGFLSPHPFVQRRLDEDRVALARVLRDEGWLDARVTLRDVAFNDDRDEATVTWSVNAGSPWTLGEVQVVGGTAIPDRASLVDRSLDLVTGSPWKRREIDRVVAKMLGEAFRQGFADARIDVEGLPRAEGAVQDLRLVVTEGRRITVRSVDVTGNTVTRDKVILREFTVIPGEPLDTDALRKSRSRVMDTQFFDSVFAVLRETTDPDRRDLEIQVQESPRTSQLRFGFGVSSDSGLFGTFDILWRNFDLADTPSSWGDFADGRAFKGGGQQLQLSLQPGTGVSNYRLAFTEPWVADRPILFGFDIYASESQLFRYDSGRSGVSLELQRRWLVPRRDLDDVYAVGLRPRIESIKVDDVQKDAAPNAFLQEGRNSVRGLALDLSWKRLDQEYLTERGWRLAYTAELVGGPLGGDFDFQRHQARANRTYTVYTDEDERVHTVSMRFGVGVAGGIADGGPVPLTERFFGGGASGIGMLRGFEYGGIGPHGRGDASKFPGRVARSIADNEGDPMGGEAVASAGVEYGFPLFADVLRGAVFLDAGNLAENTGGLRNNWRSSTGVGILVKVPILGQIPLRIDFAWPLSAESGDQRQVVSFEFTRYF